MWRRGDPERKCKQDKCMGRVRGWWTCIQCKETLPKVEFASWLSGRKTKQNDGRARCDSCDKQQKAEAKALQKRSSLEAMRQG